MDRISQDLWPVVASFMTDKTKRQMRLANTKWFNIIKYNNFKLYFTRPEDVPAITERLAKYSWPVKLEFVKSKFPRLNQYSAVISFIDYMSQLTNLVKLKVGDFISPRMFRNDEPIMKLSTLTNLESLQLESWDESCPRVLMTKLPKLKSWDGSLREADEHIVSQMSSLDSLDGESSSPNWLFERLPHPEKLTRLRTGITYQETGSKEWSRLVNLKDLQFSGLSDAPRISVELEHLTTLEKLYLNGVPFLQQQEDPDACDLKNTQRNIAALHNMAHLTNLDIILYDGQLNTDNLCFLPHLTSLRHLSIDPYSNFPDENKIACQLIPATVETLQLNLEVDLAWLTHLTNLKSLAVNTYFKNTLPTLLLDKVTSLVLSNWLEDQDLRFLESWTNLEQLSLVNPDIPASQATAPSLSNLTLLKSLSWTLRRDNPDKAVPQLRYLTNLQNLQFFTNEENDNRENIEEDYSGLSLLTNLTRLRPNFNQESFWIQLPHLTNLQFLENLHIDNDDRLLLLTAMQHLTALDIKSANKNFTGCHFTTLTTLQQLTVAGCGNHLVYKDYELLDKMPYMLRCEFMMLDFVLLDTIGK